MADHLTEQEVHLYRSREGDPVNRQRNAAHLAVCPACLERVLDSEQSTIAVNALTEAFLPSPGEEPFHLSQAELRRYVAGSDSAADRLICESHIEICEQCDAELHQLASAPPRQTERILARPWAVSGFPTPVRLAAAVALIGLLTLAAFIWWQKASRPTERDSASEMSPASGPGQPGPVAEASPPLNTEPVGANPEVVASLQDHGREIRLDRDGKLSGLEDFDASSQKLVKATLAGEGLSKPRVLEGLSAPPIQLLGEPTGESTFQIIGPAGKVITESRPSLSWQQLNGATSYVVSVFDNDFNRVATSPALSQTHWTLTAPLRWGETYSWEVVATKDGKEVTAPVAPAPRAQLKLLEANKVSVLSKLKQQKPASHLALGLTYARFGLVSDAEAEFRLLVKENPDSAAAKRLLRTVQTWR